MAERKKNTAQTNRLQLIAAEKRQARVITLFMRQNNISQIARLVGVSNRTVLRDIDRARKSWKDVAGRVYDDLLPEKIAELKELKRQAWIGWKKSLKDEVEESSTEGPKGTFNRTRRRGQSGNPAYLNTLERLLRTECQLLGMLDQEPGENQQALPVIEVVVSNRAEKDEFETITAKQFRQIAESTE